MFVSPNHSDWWQGRAATRVPGHWQVLPRASPDPVRSGVTDYAELPRRGGENSSPTARRAVRRRSRPMPT